MADGYGMAWRHLSMARITLVAKQDRYARTVIYAATTDQPQPDLKDVSYYLGERRERETKC